MNNFILEASVVIKTRLCLLSSGLEEIKVCSNGSSTSTNLATGRNNNKAVHQSTTVRES